ncbi:MAG TPA: TIM44-like domain-containing protein [Burkholderiaceae bacterium]|nr:TIM44-like domain-containing protein [Burkholderiaceae bacterium]
MKLRKSLLMAAVVALGLSVVVFDAEAKRLGGGKSMGRQSSNVTQREAAPQAPAGNAGNQAAPAQNVAPSQAAPARPATPAAAPAGQAARSKWMAPLAGIAAGLGLAALASYLGFGEGLATLMLVMLLGLAAVVVVRMVMARRAGAARGAQGPLAYSGVGQEASVRGWSPPPANDGGRAEPRAMAASAAPVVAESGFRIPADFDAEGFVRNAKSQFVRMQAAFDAADLQQLREFTTAGMFDQLKTDVEERRGGANRTDVVTLEAELLGIESDSREHTASVRFHGMTREAEGAAAEPFDEVWNLTKPVDGSSGWVLAGVQQLT